MTEFKEGTLISGKIFGKATFGLFVDIGKPFCALIEIISLKDLDYDLYLKDEQFKIGEEISAYLVYLPEMPVFQIKLVQKSQ